jgi:hypothetical protein
MEHKFEGDSEGEESVNSGKVKPIAPQGVTAGALQVLSPPIPDNLLANRLEYHILQGFG